MASPRHYGRSARDIANVMQRLQGRGFLLTHSFSCSVCSGSKGDPLLRLRYDTAKSDLNLKGMFPCTVPLVVIYGSFYVQLKYVTSISWAVPKLCAVCVCEFLA